MLCEASNVVQPRLVCSLLAGKCICMMHATVGKVEKEINKGRLIVGSLDSAAEIYPVSRASYHLALVGRPSMRRLPPRILIFFVSPSLVSDAMISPQAYLLRIVVLCDMFVAKCHGWGAETMLKTVSEHSAGR